MHAALSQNLRLFAAAAVVALLGWWSLRADEPMQPAAPPAPPAGAEQAETEPGPHSSASNRPAAAAAPAELLDIRERIGSPISEDSFAPIPLPGAEDHREPDAALFRRQVEKAAALDPAGGSRPGPPSEAVPAPRPSGGGTVDPSTASALRTAAFELDTAAHRLECVGQYDRADEVRALADALRSDARALRPAGVRRDTP